MPSLNSMKSISGYISKAALLITVIAALARPVTGQDTLRTFGPRFGIDLARFAYYFAEPAVTGAEVSMDFEVYKNIYPVVELGYSSMTDENDLFMYASQGAYSRIGMDYNLFPMKDRSVHHSITVGFRYGVSPFTHRTENMLIRSDYWGDLILDSYENSLTAHWVEIVGGMKAEVAPNLFLGWLLRYKLLLNADMDPLVVPEMIPGYGSGSNNRAFSLSYSIFYKIPLFKK